MVKNIQNIQHIFSPWSRENTPLVACHFTRNACIPFIYVYVPLKALRTLSSTRATGWMTIGRFWLFCTFPPSSSSFSFPSLLSPLFEIFFMSESVSVSESESDWNWEWEDSTIEEEDEEDTIDLDPARIADLSLLRRYTAWSALTCLIANAICAAVRLAALSTVSGIWFLPLRGQTNDL